MKFNFNFTKNTVKEEANEGTNDDAFTKLVGHFGKWQFLILVPLTFVKLSSAWVQLAILFLTPNANFWCDEFEGNVTRVPENMTCYSDCAKYKYDTSPFGTTIISEWDLVCDRRWLASFTQTMLQFGILVGSILFGFLSDRYGRRYTFLSSILLLIIFGLAIPFSSSYTVFTVLRFFIGIAAAGTMVISFVILMETVGSKYIEIIGCLYQMPFIMGHLTVPLFAYFLRDWNEYTLALGIPPVLYLLYFVVIKESPRWLISVGRVDQAVKVVTKAAQINKLPTIHIREEITKISQDIRQNKSQETRKNYTDLFRTPCLRWRIIICFIIWFVSGLGFFGVNQYISQTSPNPFVSVAAAAIIQIPANILAIWLLARLGRKITVISTFTLGGSCVLILGWVPNIFALNFILGTLGVCGIAIVCTAMYIYSSELFPTVVRNMGLGLMSTSMRIGSMIAPFVSNLTTSVPWLPTLIFGLTPLAAALLCLYLPETKGRKLPDTVEDIEYYVKR